MNLTHRILLVVFAIGLTASCAHVPRMSNENQDTANLRAKYLREHPNSPYNQQIMRGEVTAGMDVTEVLASWGVPERRIGKPSNKQECWIYTVRDDHNENSVVYELVFVDRVLSRWIFDRRTTGSGVLRADGPPQVTDPLAGTGDGAYRSNRGAPKK
jgi:hypothetical protein